MENRIEQLERSARLNRFVVVCLCAVVGSLLLMGFGQTPEKLQAKKIEVVDDKGNVLVSLAALDGQGTMTTYTPKGDLLVDIVPSESGAGGIVVYNGKGKQNLVVTDVKDGGGSVRVNNAAGDAVLSLGRNTNQAGSMTCYTADKKAVVLVTSDSGNAGTILTYDTSGKETARVPSGK